MSTCKPSGSETSQSDGKKGGVFGFMCGKKEEGDQCCNKCPPMPCFPTDNCKPAWLCNPPKPSTKKYPAPPGVKITPIGKGGRYGESTGSCADKCSSCGKMEECGKKRAPKVANKQCPMMKPKCPGKTPEKTDSGILAKITALFNSGKK